MVSMATVNRILEHGGVHTKLAMSPLSFYRMINNVNYRFCIFMKFNENFKKDRKSFKIHKKTNFMPELSSCHFVIDPVKSNGKFIDLIGPDKNDLICIFMNINENVENLEKREREKKNKKTMVIARFWMGYKIYLASLKSILMAASVVRGTS